jgi:hypothetical protein
MDRYIKPMLPNKPRGVRRGNGRRVLNGIFGVLRYDAIQPCSGSGLLRFARDDVSSPPEIPLGPPLGFGCGGLGRRGIGRHGRAHLHST